MTVPRTRSAPLAALIALAAALAVGILGASAQAPALELPEPPHEPGSLYLRGDGSPHPDGKHLRITDKTEGAELDHEELVVDDEDGSFEIRAYVIGEHGATATAYVRDSNHNLVASTEIYIGCPEAAECMSASDFHVDEGEGGRWLVDVEYDDGEGQHGAWQLEVYTEVGTAVLHLPPFPAPPVHAIRGDGSTYEDSRHMRVTDRNSKDEVVVRGELIITDDDGTFEVVAYIEGPDGAAAEVNVYRDEADGPDVDSRELTISCPDADICLKQVEFQVNSEPGTYAVDVEHVPGGPDLGPWQLEVYNFVIADADTMTMTDGESDGESDADSMAMADGESDADAMALPSGGSGGLFSASGGTASTPIIVLAASVIIGLAALGFGLRVRRNSA